MKAFTLSLVSLNYTLITKLTAAMLVMFFVTGGANSKESIEDTKMTYPNYQASSNSPILTDRETGIKASFANHATQAIFYPSDPWPLFGSYRVGRETITEFGSEIDSHVLLVVTNKESKGIYTGRILKDDLPPKNVVDTADQGGRVISTGSYFNVDLKAQCRIPGKPGKYWVVVLLGKLASPVLEFEVK